MEQGDGIIIQLPRRYDYDPDPDDGQSERTERVDILIDGGSTPRSEDWRMQDFLERLYAGGRPAVEYTVITHHDMDHFTVNQSAEDGRHTNLPRSSRHRPPARRGDGPPVERGEG
ncbi:MAG TPA: hypothetical protein VM238_06280 [Phycisphaerae bacterium]|nr:hypothetical protein [Phycisphaerae bacterium]